MNVILWKKLFKVTAYSSLIFIFVYVSILEEFKDGTRLRFWDMTATLKKWPDCYTKWGIATFSTDAEVMASQGECARMNYGLFTIPLYRLMSFISNDATIWTVFLATISLVLVVLITPHTHPSHLILFAILISPPVTLLFESGNPDLLNLVLCLIAGMALTKRWVLPFIVSISVVALHKYYGSAVWIIMTLRFFREKLLKNVVAWMIMIGSAMTIGYQIFIMGLYKFSDAGANHYGITIWDNYLRKAGFTINESLIQVIGIASLIFFGALIFRTRPSEVSEEKKLQMATNTALVMYLVFIFSYVTTSNVDYRLTFLGVAIVLDSLHLVSRSWMSRTLVFLAVASLYMSYPMGYKELIPGIPLQAIGDIILHVVVVYCCVRAWALLRRLRMDLEGNQLRI